MRIYFKYQQLPLRLMDKIAPSAKNLGKVFSFIVRAGQTLGNKWIYHLVTETCSYLFYNLQQNCLLLREYCSSIHTTGKTEEIVASFILFSIHISLIQGKTVTCKKNLPNETYLHSDHTKHNLFSAF